ncbi:MAG: DNA primase [Gemmatimonadales bacterium]
MSLIPDEIIEQVRDSADIVEVVGEHVELRKTGADWRGPCPFHGGTNRNFAVIPKKQLFYCFVCHEAGDVFTFMMKRFGMDYPTAVREMARRAGITIPERQSTGPDPREPLFSAVAAAHEWYARQLRELPDAQGARDYLTGRGFDLETLLPFGLGWAPSGGAFLEAMKTLGIGEQTLLDAGLAMRKDDGVVRSRFWNRVLFPIHDLRGRVVGFGGRVLGDGEPKYLNSPESEVFHKGRLLYHLHEAKHAMRQAEQAVLVEGFFDVLRLVAAGLHHVVAPLGTGFTTDQAVLLAKRTRQVVLLFDSDAAGLKATFRTADVLLEAGLTVLVATMPAGEDPDTLVASGGLAAVQHVLDDAMDVLERKVHLLEKKGWFATLAGRRKALDRLLPTIRAVRDPVTRDLYVARVAEAVGVAPSTVLREAEDRPRRWARPASVPESGPVGPGNAERDLLHVMLHCPDRRRSVLERLPDRALLREPEATLLEQLGQVPEGVPTGDLLTTIDEAGRGLLVHLLESPWNPDTVGAVLEGALAKLDDRRIDREIRALRSQMAVLPDQEKLDVTNRIRTLKVQQLKGRSSAR